MQLFFYGFTHDVHSNVQEFSGNIYLENFLSNPEYGSLSLKNVNYENTRYLSFLPYLPSTIVMFVCRLFNVPVLVMFLLSRLINLCICMMLCYYAIKIIPRYKKIFVLIAMFPIFFQQAIGLNMDYLTNSVALILIALIIRYRILKIKLKAKQLIYISLLGIIVGLCKFGYFPLLWLILLIPNDKFINKKVAIWYKILYIIIPLIISFSFNLFAISNPSSNNDFYSISTLLRNPIYSAKIFIKTIIYRLDLDLFRGFIDGFGWSTKYYISPILWIISSIYIIILFVNDDVKNNFSNIEKVFILSIGIIIYFLVYLICFVGWTRVGSDMINGIQSRYIIPCLPLLYMSLSNDFIIFNVKNKYKMYTILLSIIQLLVVFTLIKSFY